LGFALFSQDRDPAYDNFRRQFGISDGNSIELSETIRRERRTFMENYRNIANADYEDQLLFLIEYNNLLLEQYNRMLMYLMVTEGMLNTTLVEAQKVNYPFTHRRIYEVVKNTAEANRHLLPRN
jgi:hypothetical protein